MPDATSWTDRTGAFSIANPPRLSTAGARLTASIVLLGDVLVCVAVLGATAIVWRHSANDMAIPSVEVAGAWPKSALGWHEWRSVLVVLALGVALKFYGARRPRMPIRDVRRYLMTIGSACLGASIISVVCWGVSVPIAVQVAGSAGFFVLVTTRRLVGAGFGRSTADGSFTEVDEPDSTADREQPILAACPYQRSAKVYFDYVAGALLIVLLLPLFIAIMACVRTDGGPMLFAQKRIGRSGRTFSCFKFRTMVVDADMRLRELLESDPAAAMEWEQTQKLTVDPRVTAIGALLRQTSLDELPQLFNVLRGDMSLVGPRPIVEAEVPRYAGDIAAYYAVRPGLTGLWQVSGRSRTSYAQRVALDAMYVRNWSLRQDFAILFKTIPAVLFRRGAV